MKEKPSQRVLTEAIEVVEERLRLLTSSELEVIRLDSKPRKLNVLPIPAREFERSIGQHMIGDTLLRSFAATAETDPEASVKASVLKAFKKRRVIETRPGTKRSTLEQVTLTGAQVACAYGFAKEVGDTYVLEYYRRDYGLVVTLADGLVKDFPSAPIAVLHNPLVKLVSKIRHGKR